MRNLLPEIRWQLMKNGLSKKHPKKTLLNLHYEIWKKQKLEEKKKLDKEKSNDIQGSGTTSPNSGGASTNS